MVVQQVRGLNFIILIFSQFWEPLKQSQLEPIRKLSFSMMEPHNPTWSTLLFWRNNNVRKGGLMFLLRIVSGESFRRGVTSQWVVHPLSNFRDSQVLEGDYGSSTTTTLTLAWTKVGVSKHGSFSFISFSMDQ